MRVVVASESVEQREHLRPHLLGAGLECTAPDCVTYSELEGRLAHAGADLVVVRVGADRESALPVLKQVEGRANGAILAVGPPGDAAFILQVMRSGAREYLDETKVREELPVVLERFRQAGLLQTKVGRTVAVTAGAPGSGVTTVATNLAFALAVHHPKQVVLAEIGTDVPSLALALDLQPKHGAGDLVRDWNRTDATMIRQSLAEHAAGVQVLAHTPESLTSASVEPPAMRHLALLLRTLYDWTVLDLGHSAHPSALEAMRLADVVLVVTRLDVPALRLSRRYIKDLADQGIPLERLRPVANFFGQRKQLPWRQAQETLGLPVVIWVPDDPATLNQALNQGRPLIQTASRAKITRRFQELAQQLNGKA
jgi:pilus assembly protein CpaE